MPCYSIQTMSISLEALNRNLLESAIIATGLSYTREGDIFYLDNIEIGAGNTAIVQTGYNGQLNMIKRSYSEHVIKKVARSKKWSGQWKKLKNGNKVTMKRF